MPKAFAKSLRERKSARIPMLFGHVQQHMPVGVWETMIEDSVGLRVKGRLILESQEARQLHAVMKARAEIGISIGYKTITADYVEDGGEMTRKLVEVDLYEISLVTIPMQDNARVLRVKSAEHAAAEQARALEAKAIADAVRALEDHATLLDIRMALTARTHA
jgi:HK97 family phage prohead protease